MNYTISKSKDFVGQTVTLKGWMYNKRGSGKISFLQLRDGSGYIQGVVEQSTVSEETWNASQSLTIESSCEVTGILKEEPRSPSGFELQVQEVKVVNIAPEFPIGKKEHGPEFLFENRDLYLRSKTPWAVLRIRDQVFRSITDYFFENGFVRFDTPVLQPTSAEDTSQLFEMDYYESKMYLTQSGQLYLEAGIMGLGKAYDFGPVFRAEKSKTRNHLSEFWMMDAEMAYHNQQMNEDVQEVLVKRIIKDCLENCKEELRVLERDTTVLQRAVNEKFIRIKQYDAKKLLEDKGFKVDYKDDMTTEEEIEIGNHFGIPVFIEDYPFEVKAFYMKNYVDERGMKRAVNADLIAPEEAREIIGGSQREDDYNKLLTELKARNYKVEDYEWYLNIRKYGSVEHAGFGIGLERTVRWISGVHHIRETIPFPRTMVLNKP
jgi:asparaginyl-tRNA synthetase